MKSTAASLWLGSAAIQSATSYAANDKLSIACVGVGNQGNHNLSFMQTQHIVALCDVDERRTASYADSFPEAKTYADYRVMLDELDREIDGVVASTPNHSHAVVAMAALKRGKHCYCEKPLTHTIAEARALQRVAREQGVVTQMGIQIHAETNYRRVVELIRAGVVGEVTDAHVWFGQPGGYRRYGQLVDRPAGEPVPEGLHWDLWAGPAPIRPFHPCYHPHDWHYWWDYGNGSLGNMGCHYMDLVFWALGLTHPETVRSEGPAPHPDSTPLWLDCHWHFPKRAGQAPVNVHWYHGRNLPEALKDLGAPDWPAGVLFEGTKGRLASDYSRRALLPEADFAGFVPPPPTIPDAARNHREEWYEACKGNGKTLAHFDYAAPLTETILLGNVAHRAGGTLEWDAAKLIVKDNAAANALLQYEYRPGWKL